MLRWQLALQGLFVLCAGIPIWRDVASFPRDGMLLFFFYIVVVLAQRRASSFAPSRRRTFRARIAHVLQHAAHGSLYR